MEIVEGLLEEIEQDEQKFISFISEFTEKALAEAGLFPRLSLARLIEAKGAWKNDLHRVGGNEPKLENGLDHFKRAGHLAFWLRRALPIVEYVDTTQNLGDAEGYPLDEQQKKFRELIAAYGNEFIAFEIGYQFCKYYEVAAGSERASNLILGEDFIRTTCHFFKFKSVSPHAMFMVYKSIFLQ